MLLNVCDSQRITRNEDKKKCFYLLILIKRNHDIHTNVECNNNAQITISICQLFALNNDQWAMA